MRKMAKREFSSTDKKEYPFISNQMPTPLTLGELISYGAIEGSEDAYNDENGFDYSDPDSSLLYYAGKPFTGLYYELYPNGGIELYSKYQDGVLVEDCFEFYKNGKIKSYSYISKDRLNSYSCSFNEDGKLILRNCFANGKFEQEKFN